MQRKILIRFGIMFIVLLFGVFWGFNYLKGKNIFKKQSLYFAVYTQINGLKIGSGVTYKGINIGQVKNIRFADEYCNKIVVEMYIDDKYKLPRGSVAEIYNTDIMGNKGMRIATYNANNVYYQPGDTFPSELKTSIIDELSAQLAPLKGKSENVLVALDSIIKVTNKVIVSNQSYLNQSIINLNNSLHNIDVITSNLMAMLETPNGKLYISVNQLQQFTQMLSDNRRDIEKTIKKISQLSDTISASELYTTLNNTNETVVNIRELSGKINNGQGSMGKLFNNDSLYINLTKTLNTLDSLTQQISKNPRKFIKFSVF